MSRIRKRQHRMTFCSGCRLSLADHKPNNARLTPVLQGLQKTRVTYGVLQGGLHGRGCRKEAIRLPGASMKDGMTCCTACPPSVTSLPLEPHLPAPSCKTDSGATCPPAHAARVHVNNLLELWKGDKKGRPSRSCHDLVRDVRVARAVIC